MIGDGRILWNDAIYSSLMFANECYFLLPLESSPPQDVWTEVGKDF